MFNIILKKIKNVLKKNNYVFYVGGSSFLPEPLKKEEELNYLTILSDSDDLNLKKEARDILIEHNLRLVVYLAKKYENTKMDLEDLIGIGTVGLIKGVETYKLDKDIKLVTYISRCISNEILMSLRKNKKRKAEVSFDDSLSFDNEGNSLHLEDILGTDIDIVTKGIEKETERKMMIDEIMKLKDRDKEIMCNRYGLFGKEEKTQKEVALLLGISQSYISRIEKKIISKLKNIVNV